MYQEAGKISASHEASHTPATEITHGQTVPGAFKKPGRGSSTIKYYLVKKKKKRFSASTWSDGQVGLPRVGLIGLVLSGKRDEENTPQLASLYKAPPFGSENND